MALHVQRGDIFGITYVASVANNWSATLKVMDSRGKIQKYTYRQNAATADRTAQSFTTRRIASDGEIVSFGAAVGSVAATRRGQFYMNAFVLGTPEEDVEIALAHGYLFDGKSLSLGEFIDPGPGSGNGNRRWAALATNIAGDAPAEIALEATNAYRRYRGFILYYNAIGAATRTVFMELRRIGGALPTGFGTDANTDIWQSPSLTLTDTEEGTILSKERFQNTNDTGTTGTATDIVPWPIDVDENDNAALLPVATNGLAADTFSIFADVEEWLQL